MASIRIRNKKLSCKTFKLQKCAWLSGLWKPPPDCVFCLKPLPNCTLTHIPEFHASPNSQMDFGEIKSNISNQNPKMVSHCISNELKASPSPLRAFVTAFPSWTSSPSTPLSAVQIHWFHMPSIFLLCLLIILPRMPCPCPWILQWLFFLINRLYF